MINLVVAMSQQVQREEKVARSRRILRVSDQDQEPSSETPEEDFGIHARIPTSSASGPAWSASVRPGSSTNLTNFRRAVYSCIPAPTLMVRNRAVVTIHAFRTRDSRSAILCLSFIASSFLEMTSLATGAF